MELEPKIEINVSWPDIGRAVLDLIKDRFANPFPLEVQPRGAARLLDEHLYEPSPIPEE